MSVELVLLMGLFFIIAVVYSAAGFGGGSSYLAALALLPIAFIDIRIIALLCNITVTAGTSYLFYKNGFIPIKKILPLIGLSIPLAYVGGRYPITESLFYVILGGSLFLAGVLMLVQNDTIRKISIPAYANGIIGGAIGLLSGLVGIGGGIFLSPVLHLSKWNRTKIIAGTTSLFILVNSIAGLSGQLVTNGIPENYSYILLLMSTVFIGAQIGSRISIFNLAPKTVKKTTGIVILVVASRLLYKYLVS